jgi:hypothetical protein
MSLVTEVDAFYFDHRDCGKARCCRRDEHCVVAVERSLTA